MSDERGDERNERIAATEAAGEGLLASLQDAGYRIQSLNDLYRPGTDLSAAVAPLLSWLPRVHDPGLIGFIAQMLQKPWAAPVAVGPLLEKFRAMGANPRDRGDAFLSQWAVGVAISRLADQDHLPQLIEIARDRQYGHSRGAVVRRLGGMRARKTEVVPVLEDLLDDPSVRDEAARALDKLGA